MAGVPAPCPDHPAWPLFLGTHTFSCCFFSINWQPPQPRVKVSQGPGLRDTEMNREAGTEMHHKKWNKTRSTDELRATQALG